MMKSVTIYTDGGCKPNPGPGGWGVLLIYGQVEKTLSGGAAQTTNNQMELTAAITALEALKEPCAVTLYTDSEYMKKGITEWMYNWQRNGWLTASKKPVKNKELWQRLYAQTQRHEMTWEWVKAHAGNVHNELVDQLATDARQEFEA